VRAFAGTTADGREIRVTEDGRVFVDEVEQALDGDPSFAIRTYRDGGTRVFRCVNGVLTLPHRVNSDDRVPRWETREAIAARLDALMAYEPATGGPIRVVGVVVALDATNVTENPVPLFTLGEAVLSPGDAVTFRYPRIEVK
jgi:hypothetical protein